MSTKQETAAATCEPATQSTSIEVNPTATNNTSSLTSKAPAMSTAAAAAKAAVSPTKTDGITIANVENGGTGGPDKRTLTAVKNGDAAGSRAARSGSGNNDATDVAGGIQLPKSILDKLFHSYSVKQHRGGLKWFLLAAVLFTLFSLVVPRSQGLATKIISLVVLYLYVLFYVVLVKGSKLIGPDAPNWRRKFFKILINLTPHAIWRLAVLHMACFMTFQDEVQVRDILGWAILLQLLVFVGLPVQVFQSGLYIALASISLFAVSSISSIPEVMYYEQLSANVVLVCCASAIGLLFYYMGKAKQKRAFLEAMKSLEVKMIIEEESAEQERLLLSVLPKHVAVKMRQDLGSTSSEPFKKIYMSRHENVSILYADIVGFTAISSTYSAQDLVKMLNELFARFDRLSEKYQQLRIKILGDCYYCISGAPDERPDHAVLCVHMGLSMVKAIKYVQQKTNSPVDMRVGIHTGAVLAGILGQRQWQFDVYSKDVELANKMESSGKAGRVHISDKTLAFLSGEFEVEPAYGEKREEALRIAGLKTYFIKKVLKPFSSPATKKTTNEMIANNDNDQEGLDDELLPETTANEETKGNGVGGEGDGAANGQAQNGQQQNGHTNGIEGSPTKMDKQEVFKKRLQEELVAKDEHQNLSKDANCLLRFKNHKLESAYAAYREPYSSVPLAAALLVQLIDIVYSFIVLPRSALHFVNISAPLIPIAMLVLISVAESFPGFFPTFFVNISKRFNDITFVRELAAIIIALIIGFSNIVDMYFFVTYLKMSNIVTTADIPTNDTEVMLEAGPVSFFVVAESSLNVMPSYFSNFGVLILLSIAVIAQLTHMTKIVLMVGIALCHCYCNIFLLSDLYDFEDLLKDRDHVPTCIYTSSMLVLAAIALSFIARHMDHEDRVIFKWKTEVAEQKEMATDMRERNEALVYNVLPVHVAEHFMKNTKRSHDDLYSQSYSEVGVLFASMPNFSDFYSEETVNNQGLECLRFLNEVISDFDALLELPQFQDIIKIKTIGSTYMAASGINLNRVSHPDDPITKRWSHLDILVEFALELQKALKGINEQSFNHFVLKMGINHGPITAGVIGARKPHYDIWGNTVNVASRMESTGKAGAIQVTEETCTILQEFGYTFLQRGLVSVKGKGELMTYYLQGKSDCKQSLAATLKSTTSPTPSTRQDDVSSSDGVLTSSNNDYADAKTPLLNAKSGEECPAKDDSLGTPAKSGAHTNTEQQALIE